MKFRMCFESSFFFLWISNFTDICSYCRYYLLLFIIASLRIHTFLPCVTWKSCHACAYLVSQHSRPNTPITCWSFLAQKSNYKCHWIKLPLEHGSCFLPLLWSLVSDAFAKVGFSIRSSSKSCTGFSHRQSISSCSRGFF